MRIVLIYLILLFSIPLFSQKAGKFQHLEYEFYEPLPELDKNNKLVFTKRPATKIMVLRTFLNDSIFTDSSFFGVAWDSKRFQNVDTFKCINNVWQHKFNDSFYYFFSSDSFTKKNKIYWLKRENNPYSKRDFYKIELTPIEKYKKNGIDIFVFDYKDRYKQGKFIFSPLIGTIGFEFYDTNRYKILIKKNHLKYLRFHQRNKYLRN